MFEKSLNDYKDEAKFKSRSTQSSGQQEPIKFQSCITSTISLTICKELTASQLENLAVMVHWSVT